MVGKMHNFNEFWFKQKQARRPECDCLVLNAAVIVDPSSKQNIATGSDQIFSELASAEETSLKCMGCTKQAATLNSMQSDANVSENGGENSVGEFFSKSANYDREPASESPTDEFSPSYTSVTCLNPWAWIENRLSPCNKKSPVKCGINYSWHPLRHAALVTIENVAARDSRRSPVPKLLKTGYIRMRVCSCHPITFQQSGRRLSSP